MSDWAISIVGGFGIGCLTASLMFFIGEWYKKRRSMRIIKARLHKACTS